MEAKFVSPVKAALGRSGLSATAKLLIICGKLHERGLLSVEEKGIMKKLICTGHPLIAKLDTSTQAFMTPLVDTVFAIHVRRCERILDFLYKFCSTADGKLISRAERTETLNKNNSFVYGEIEYQSFALILREILPLVRSKGTFYDLGSGTGRPVFAAALLADFRKLVGVEYLQGLCEASYQVHERYEQFLAQNKNFKADVPQEIKFLQADLTKFDFSDGDVVFANSTCFHEELVAQIAKQGEALAPGSLVITLTKSLSSPHFEELSKRKYRMSWGGATVYVHRRRAPSEMV